MAKSKYAIDRFYALHEKQNVSRYCYGIYNRRTKESIIVERCTEDGITKENLRWSKKGKFNGTPFATRKLADKMLKRVHHMFLDDSEIVRIQNVIITRVQIIRESHYQKGSVSIIKNGKEVLQ